MPIKFKPARTTAITTAAKTETGTVESTESADIIEGEIVEEHAKEGADKSDAIAIAADRVSLGLAVSGRATSATSAADFLEQTADKGVRPTSDQHAALVNIFDWFDEPAKVGDRDSVISVLRGYAGGGKTFVANIVVEGLVALGYCRRDEILGIAPTHAAAKNLANMAQIETKTVHSFLGLIMASVKLSAADKKELARLREASAIAVDFSSEDTDKLSRLMFLEQAQLEKKKELRPAIDPDKFAEERVIPKVIIWDEIFMSNEALIHAMANTVVFNYALPFAPKILGMGDPGQCPPVGERMSKADAYNTLGNLTQVVRQGGTLLDYVTDIRNSKEESEIPYLHQMHLSAANAQDDYSIARMPEEGAPESPDYGIVPMWQEQAKSVGLENIRVITTSNARVRELNEKLYRATYPDRAFEQPYRLGDQALTLGPIMRDPKYPDTPGAGEGAILFPTSTVIRIDKALAPRKVASPFGTEYFVSSVSAHTGGTPHMVELMHPLQIGQWSDEIGSAFSMARSTNSKGKKTGRGQAGKYAKVAWETFGLKSWEQTIKEPTDPEEAARLRANYLKWQQWSRGDVALGFDQPVSKQEFTAIKKLLWREYHALRQLADNTSMTFASTVNRAQGQTIPLVILDFLNFLPRDYKKKDDTWDTLKMLYTAASRVGEKDGHEAQLILMY